MHAFKSILILLFLQASKHYDCSHKIHSLKYLQKYLLSVIISFACIKLFLSFLKTKKEKQIQIKWVHFSFLPFKQCFIKITRREDWLHYFPSIFLFFFGGLILILQFVSILLKKAEISSERIRKQLGLIYQYFPCYLFILHRIERISRM